MKKFARTLLSAILGLSACTHLSAAAFDFDSSARNAPVLPGLRLGALGVAPAPEVGRAVDVSFVCEPGRIYHGGPCDPAIRPGPVGLGSAYRWSGGDCGEYTPSGSLIQWVNRDQCRGSQGSGFRWSGGDCGEYTPNGSLIQWVDRDFCRERSGSSFRWSGGDCGEYTPSGSLIRWVNRDSCRSSQGSSFRWSGGDCGEYTPSGSLVQWVNRDYCR